MKIGDAIETANRKIAQFSSWAIILLIFIMAYEVVARYVFNSPTIWSYEMSYFLSSFFIVLSLAYTLQTKDHVSIDIIYNKFSEKTQTILSIIFTLMFFFPMWILIAYYMFPLVMGSLETGERSSYGSWLPVIWPFRLWILIGIIMLLLQGIVEFARDLYKLFGGGAKQNGSSI